VMKDGQASREAAAFHTKRTEWSRFSQDRARSGGGAAPTGLSRRTGRSGDQP